MVEELDDHGTRAICVWRSGRCSIVILKSCRRQRGGGEEENKREIKRIRVGCRVCSGE